jgi:hypothetical protein
LFPSAWMCSLLGYTQHVLRPQFYHLHNRAAILKILTFGNCVKILSPWGSVDRENSIPAYPR